MTLCSHGSQTGIRGGLPIGKIWQAKRLPYNLFRVAATMFFVLPCPRQAGRLPYNSRARDCLWLDLAFRRQGLLLSKSPFRQIAQGTQTGPEAVLSQGAGE